MNESFSMPSVLPFRSTRRLRTVLALGAVGVAVLTTLGPFLGLSSLASLGPGLVPMSPLAAVLVVLLGGAIVTMNGWPESVTARRLACAIAALVALLTLLFIRGHAMGDTLVVERWATQRWPQIQLTSLLTDLSLLGVTLSFLCRWLPSRASWGTRQAAALFALSPLVIGVVVLISYIAGAPLLYGSGHIPMSIPSALCALCLGLPMLLAAGFNAWPLAMFRLRVGRARTWSIFGVSAGALTLFLLIGPLVLIGGSFLLRGQIQAARARSRIELTAIAEVKARQIADWYGERRGGAEVIGRSALIQRQFSQYLSAAPVAPSEGDLRAWMKTLQETYQYRRVVLFDGGGQVKISVPPEESPMASELDATEISLALHAREVLAMDLHQNPGPSDIHLSFWVPIRGGSTQAKPDGALALVLDPRQFLYPLIQSWPTDSASAETLLVRRDGNDVLYLNDLRHQAHTAMNLRVALAEKPDMPAALAVQGKEGLVEGTDYRGTPVLSVLKKIPGTDWHMVAKVDEAEIYGPIRQRIWASGLGLVGVLALVGAILGLLLRRHDATMLRQQLLLAQRFEWLMREANDIILLMDGTGRILEANDRALKSYGYGASELIGKSVLDLRVTEVRAVGLELYEQTKALGAMRFESTHQRKDGSTFPVEVSARAVTLDGERQVISFIRDITERRAQDREIQRMTQLYAALSQVNQAIVWSPSREALFDKLCEVMVEFGKFDMAWIGLNDPLSNEVSVVAKYGDTKDYLGRIRVESGDSPLGAGPLGTAIREARPCVENDFLSAAGIEPWRDAATEAGFHSMAAFPIRQAGKVVGGLVVYASVIDFFGHPESALLEEAAMDISFALDHLALDDQRRGAEVALLESERMLREAQEAGQIGTYTWFIREDHWKCSPFLEQIFGINPDHPRDLEGWTKIIARDFRATMQAYVAGIIERHERFDLDYPIVRVSDGAARWVHGQGDIQWDSEGRPVALVGIIQDITDRKRSERELKKIQMAVEQSPLSIVITDPQGIIEYVNPAFSATAGYTSAEVIGQNPRVLKSPTTPPDHYRQMWETLARGDIWVGEFENLKKGGEPFQEHAIIAPVRDEAGVLTGYIAIKEDITLAMLEKAERRTLEAQLHQSQKLESLGSLAGGVAHDMNNVLGAILGLASTLRETADPFSPGAKSLDTIMNACMRGRGVVKGLLYFAKKDLQEERSIDLNNLVKEMSQLLSHTTLKRVLLRMDMRDGLNLLRGDAGALSHALMNLCVNAMDAMPNGGTLCIKTDHTQEGGLLLSVRDTGEGMNPEVLAKAMEPFFTTKPVGKGTGLGLAMVYGTMKAHEGTFELLSVAGKGTEAILRFPASRVEVPLPEVPVELLAPAEPHEHLRILLVDDDELIRESVAPLLEVLGHTVATAPGGARALKQLESGLPVDLVILDMNMPGMSGAEALPRILALRPGLPVIMATGYSDQEIAPLLEGHPSVTSLRKPFSLSEVRRAMTAMKIHTVVQLDPKPTT